MNYIPIHVHTYDSLTDSCSSFKEYVQLAVENGHRALASTEHGIPLSWVSKKRLCDEAGIKFLHGVEIYLTETLEEKIRDNYHTILIAKNLEGVKEINRLVSMSRDERHMYFNGRLSFDEFLSISDNVIKTSACLASPLWQLPETHPRYKEIAKGYDFLEVQPHIDSDQVEFNKRLSKLSKELDIPLIAGTDTHSASSYKAECRQILLYSKKQSYGNEDSFDLTYKTYDQLVDMFDAQEALSTSEFMEAIDNTNALNEMVEDFQLDTKIKYPILYGSHEADSKKFAETVETRFAQKLEAGVIPPVQKQGFEESIKEEMRVFRKLKMDGLA